MSSKIVLAGSDVPRSEEFTIELSDEDPPYLEELYRQISMEVFEQERAIRKVLQRIALIDSGSQKRPSPLFFAGPSGCGKSYLTEVAARIWLGEPRDGETPPLVSIAGENFKESHTVSALLGAPAGYVGHGAGTSRTKSPLEDIGVFDEERDFFTVERLGEKWVEEELARYRSDIPKEFRDEEFLKDIKDYVLKEKWKEWGEPNPNLPPRSVLRVDEFEKMHEEVQKQFLSIINDGRLQLRNSGGKVIDFRGCLIIFTSNLGTEEITKLIEDKPVGFHPETSDADAEKITDQQIYERVKKRVKKDLDPALFSRIGHDGLVVFHKLSQRGFEKIIDKEIRDIQREYSGEDSEKGILMISVTPEFKDFIIREADAPTEGARMITRLIDKHMRLPLAKRVGAGDLLMGDAILFTVVNGDVKMKMMPRPSGMEIHRFSPRRQKRDEKALQEELFGDFLKTYLAVVEEDANNIRREIAKKYDEEPDDSTEDDDDNGEDYDEEDEDYDEDDYDEDGYDEDG